MNPLRARIALTCQSGWRKGWSLMAGAVLVIMLSGPAAWAGDKSDKSGKEDHERGRAAVLAGEVLPLATVLEQLRRTHPGQVLELELEREDGRWIYEVKLLQTDGQLLKLEVDARTAQVIEVKRKHGGKDARQPDPKKDDRR